MWGFRRGVVERVTYDVGYVGFEPSIVVASLGVANTI